MNAYCILFADNFRNDTLQGLTKDRTLASLPVAARYRMVDFMLSSLVKAGVSDVAIVTNNNYKSLVDHVGWGKDWDLDRKNSGLKIITPMANPLSHKLAKNKIEALASTILYADSVLQEYCILADSNIIGNVDFKEMLRLHEATHADITLAYTHKFPEKNESELILGENHKVIDSLYHYDGWNTVCPTQVKIYIMTKDLFKGIVKKGITLGWENILVDYVSKNLDTLNVSAYEIKGYCKTIHTIDDYYQFNTDLLQEEIRRELFLSGTDILTRVQDSVPTTYGETAIAKNSLLADGCFVKGTVENSILFRDVVIEEGAVVRNSIVLSGTVVEKGAVLDYVIADKYAHITENTELKGNANCPVVVEKQKVV